MDPFSRSPGDPAPAPSAADLDELLATLATTDSFSVPAEGPWETTAIALVPEPETILESARSSAHGGRAKRKAYLQALVPEQWQSILGRAAVPRVIDRDLFEKILVAPLAPDRRPEYAEFLDLPEVELLGNPDPKDPSSGRCRIRWRDRNDSLRQCFDPSTRAPSQEFLDLTRALVAYYDARREMDSLERLYHLAALGDPAAEVEFRRRFGEAEAGFNLPLCQELVGLFDDAAFLDAPADPAATEEVRPRPGFERLIGTRDECRSRLQASSLWADEYYRTGTFLQRKGLVEALQEVVERPGGDGPWILHVHGGGGRGKTMFVRWAIARWAVPRRIPCSLVDLGGERFAEMAGEPVRVWLTFARQLSRQLPEAAGALNKLIQNLNVKRQRADSSERVSSDRVPDSVSWDADNAHRQLGSALSFYGDRPILIVLDTLEQGVLTAGRAVADLVRAFDHVRQNYCHGLSLLLTGRYDFSEEVAGQERVPGFSAEFGGSTLTREVDLFDASEARRYLKERRGLGRDPRVGQVIKLFEKARRPATARPGSARRGAPRHHIHPLKLALVADLLQGDPDLKVDELDRAGIEMTFLIDRVLLQVDFATRWALLFGAVPRRLTRDFLKDVLTPAIVKVLARGGLTPAEESQYPEPIRQKKVLRGDGPTAPPAPPDLWRTLVEYASTSSWVQLVRGPEDAIELHTEVVEAVRRLAQADPGQFLTLHREALEFFEWVAEYRPAQWGEAISEAIYHRFQLGERGGAVKFWRDQLTEADRRGRSDWRRDLAADLRGPDYVDDDLTPRTSWDGQALLPPGAVAEACCEEADACVAIALWDQSPRARLTARGQVAQAHARFERALLKVDDPDLIVPPARRDLLRIHLLLLTDQEGQRQALELARALKDRVFSRSAGPVTERDRFLALATLAELASALDEPDAIELLARAIREAEEHPEWARAEWRAELRQQLAKTAIDRQDVDAARDVIDALKGLEATPEDTLRVALHASRFGLMCGEFGSVIQEAEQLKPPTRARPGARYDLHLLVLLNAAEAALHRLQPQDALRRSDEVLGHLEQYRPTDKTAVARRNWVHANARWFRARCLLALYDFDGGGAELEQALELAKAFGRSEGLVFDIRSSYIITLLREGGNPAAAREGLDSSAAPSPRPDSPEAFVHQLLLSEVDHAAGDRTLAVQRLEPLLRDARPDEDPPWRTIRLSIHCLALEHEMDRCRDWLISALSRMPPVARWGFHRELARCPVLESSLTPVEEARLGLPSSDDLQARDRSIRSLYEAEFWRVFNRSEAAEARLRAAGRLIQRGDSFFPVRPLLQAWHRLSPELPAEEINGATAGLVRKVPKFLVEFARWPLLCAAVLTEQAERDSLRGDRKAARSWHEQAGRYLKEVQSSSAWPARWERLRVSLAGDSRALESTFPDRTMEVLSVNSATGPGSAPLALIIPKVVFRVGARANFLEAELDGGGYEPGIRKVLNDVLDLPAPFVATGYEVAERLLKIGSPFWTKSLALIEPSVRHDLFRPPMPPGRPTADLQLVGEPDVHALPWECARLHPDPSTPTLGVAPGLRHVYRSARRWGGASNVVEWVQLALGRLQRMNPGSIGNWDRVTRLALSAFQKDQGLPANGLVDAATRAALDGALRPIVGPASALIVASPNLRLKGRENDSGMLVKLYGDCGLEPVFVARSQEELPVGPLQGGVSILHLIAQVEEDGGDFYLAFDRPSDSPRPGPEWEPGSSAANGARISLSAVDRLIHQIGSPGLKPIVVLQAIPAGASPLECVRQVLLRNSFAARLHLLGNVQAVIATGRFPVTPEWLAEFSCQIEAGASVAVLARSFRELGTPGLSSASPRWAENLLVAATALFAHDPDTVPQRSGRLS